MGFSWHGSRGISVGFGAELRRMAWHLGKSAGIWEIGLYCAQGPRERWHLDCILAGSGGQGLGRPEPQICPQAWRGCVMAQLYAPNRPE